MQFIDPNNHLLQILSQSRHVRSGELREEAHTNSEKLTTAAVVDQYLPLKAPLQFWEFDFLRIERFSWIWKKPWNWPGQLKASSHVRTRFRSFVMLCDERFMICVIFEADQRSIQTQHSSSVANLKRTNYPCFLVYFIMIH